MRLIDADALKQMLPAPIEDEYKYVHKIIDNAPTITPDMAQVLAYESGKAIADRPTGEHKCVTCKHCNGEIFNNYCRECSRAWADLYEEAENDSDS